jgi:hypothetical protein
MNGLSVWVARRTKLMAMPARTALPIAIKSPVKEAPEPSRITSIAPQLQIAMQTKTRGPMRSPKKRAPKMATKSG